MGLVPLQAKEAVHAVNTQWSLVACVTLAGPVTLSAAISAAVAVSAARPLRPTLAFLEGTNLCLEDAPGLDHFFFLTCTSQHAHSLTVIRIPYHLNLAPFLLREQEPES